MRRATGLSSLSSSLCAAGSNSIVHFCVEAIAAHHFVEWDRPAAARAHSFQPLLGEVNVFEFLEVLKDRLASVVSLGAASALGETPKAFFDGFGKANG